MSIISDKISEAIKHLNNNEVIGFPTETVYGLAANIHSETAINKIFAIKKRPSFNPLIVHIKSASELHLVAKNIPEKAILLAKKFWPGGLTLILPKQDFISNLITANKPTVAVRVPNHEIALSLLNQLNFPLAAPSANPFMSISPTSAAQVERYFSSQIPMVLEGGLCKKGVESTIIGFENNEPVLCRFGAISVEEIESVVGKIKIFTATEKVVAPGMHYRHYAPNTKIILCESIKNQIQDYKNQKIGILSFSEKYEFSNVFHTEILSQNENFEEAAKNLYAALHKLDRLDLDVILTQKVPDFDLGKTINDRLVRACG
jgi:L-threonylcarbamoyladenylate synthase